MAQTWRSVWLGVVATGLVAGYSSVATAKASAHSHATSNHRHPASARVTGHATAASQAHKAPRKRTRQVAATPPHRPGRARLAAAAHGPAPHHAHAAASKRIIAQKPAGGVRLAMATKAPRFANVPASLRPLIVIDPGHGGRDPGAIGPRATQEKDITLAIALDLKHALDAGHRYRTAMTRTRDETISLPERLAFARRHDADLLIAIHADASPNHNARGASVYVSSGAGVSHLAASSHNSAQIAQALTATAPAPGPTSAWLQYSMIDQLSDEVSMVVAPARSAHLYVLGARSIPSVLLETGFISNKQDEALLRKPSYRHRIVGAIRDAVDDYFRGLKKTAPRT